MKTSVICIVMLAFITACSSSGSRYTFWEISKFHIDTAALHNLDEIKLLYSSRGPDDNKDLNYYIHYVVVSQKTGDTVNILSPDLIKLSESDKDKVFNYFDGNSIIFKTSHANPDMVKKIGKIARDPEFDSIADNHYPAVIGTIGTYTENSH